MILIDGHDIIRTRSLIQTLGFFDHLFPNDVLSNSSSSSVVKATRTTEAAGHDFHSHPSSPHSPEEISKDDHLHHHMLKQQQQQQHKHVATTTTTTSTRIRFHPEVQVMEIPSYKEYSNDEKKAIWRNSAELRQIVQRNKREFAAERWDWKQAVEEDGMFFDKTSQLYIHPVHLGGTIADLVC